MKFAVVLALLASAGVTHAQQASNQGPPSKWDPKAPQALHSTSGEARHPGNQSRRGRNWSREHSEWNVGFRFEYHEGGWGYPPPSCEPPVCPPPLPVCHDTRTERVVVPGYWTCEQVYDHCGRPLFDHCGRPVTRQVYVPGYTEIVTYRLERSRYWDGWCWRPTEQWVVCSRERVHC